MSGIDWKVAPPFLGYNKTRLKEDSTLLATIGEGDDPFVAVWEYGKGRTMAFMSFRYSIGAMASSGGSTTHNSGHRL